MKHIYTVVLFLLCTTLLSAQNVPELLYYNFDGSGTKVPNLASSPPAGTDTATIMGSIIQGSSSFLCGGSLIGSGNSASTDYLNTGWNTELSGMSWTISFRSSQFAPNSTLYYIFGDLNAGSFRCFTNGVAGPNNWILRGTGITDVLINGGAITASTMTTFVYDQPANTIYGYLNGTLVTTVPQGATPVISTTGGPFKVMGYSTNVGAPSGGLLDEFRLYNRALSAAEIAELYNPYATPGFLGADQDFCFSSGPVPLQLPFPASVPGITWSDGSALPFLPVAGADTFSVSISGDCGSGSDTIVIGNLATSGAISVTACQNLGYTSAAGNFYTTSGIYTDTLLNAAGCDSILTINLSITAVNTTLTQSGTSGEIFTASTGADSYQWINCSTQTPVAGATASTFTAGIAGQYAVVVTENNCSDTSACLATAPDLSLHTGINTQLLKLYPNPTQGSFRLETGAYEGPLQLELLNSVGQVLQSSELNGNSIQINIEGARGLYFIRLTNAAGEKAVLRIIKE